MPHYEFLALDDLTYVPNNPHVSTGLHLDNVIWGFTSFYEANWYRVARISRVRP